MVATSTDTRSAGGAIDLTTPLGDDLHRALREASLAGRTARDGVSGATIVLRHHDVDRLARDRRLAGVGLAAFELLGTDHVSLRRWSGDTLVTHEGATHHRLRRLVSRAFTPRAAERLRSEAATLAAAALDDLRTDGGGDLREALALLPMDVMCRLLGVPAADVAQVAGWVDALALAAGRRAPDQVAAATTAAGELLAYLGELVARRTTDQGTDPGTDFVTALMAAGGGSGALAQDEVVDLVATLLVAGHDATASQLACTLHTLLRHPDQVHRLRGDRSLLASAVAETIRYEPSVAFVPCTTTEPLDLNGRHPAGSLLFLSRASANRDPRVWDHGDVFDVGRFAAPDAPHLLTLGAGLHRCLGDTLARLTIEEGVGAVLDLGEIESTEDPASVPWRAMLGRGPARVPAAVVSWRTAIAA